MLTLKSSVFTVMGTSPEIWISLKMMFISGICRLSTCAEGTVQVFKLEVPTKSLYHKVPTQEKDRLNVFMSEMQTTFELCQNDLCPDYYDLEEQ